MFDNVRCRYPLPLEGANDITYQTKSFDTPSLDNFEIREDGSLWHEDYAIEDRSDPTKEGIAGLIGMLTRVNERWEPYTDFTGEVSFYELLENPAQKPGYRHIDSGWLEWSAYFVKGQLQGAINLITHTLPGEAEKEP